MAIIWIDDDTEIIDPVVRPLEQAGYEIIRFRTIHDVLEAIEKIRNSELILLDMIIPPGEVTENYGHYAGARLLCKLRDEGISIPIIGFSVVQEEKVREQLKKCNVTKYIRKPALPSELEEAVRSTLGRKGQTGTVA
jgi:DNA-binding response OmpR family regulator